MVPDERDTRMSDWTGFWQRCTLCSRCRHHLSFCLAPDLSSQTLIPYSWSNTRFWLRRETKLHPSWVRLAYVSRFANVTVWNQSKFIGVKNVETFRLKSRKVSMGMHVVASCCCCRTSYCIDFSFEGWLTQMFLLYWQTSLKKPAHDEKRSEHDLDIKWVEAALNGTSVGKSRW